MEWWQWIGVVAGALTAVFTGTFAGLAIYNHCKRLRLHLVGYGKQVVGLTGAILYSAIVEKKGIGVPCGCQATVVFQRSQLTTHLYPLGVEGELLTDAPEEEGRVPTFSGVPLFTEYPPPDRGISMGAYTFIERCGPNRSAEEYEAAKHQRITFTISSANAAGLSRTVSFAHIIAKAKGTPLTKV